jgi:hypothetical protein
MKMRATARQALISVDAIRKVKAAILRLAVPENKEYLPGSRVYFFSPHPFKGRQRKDAKRWRGPATVIAKENEHGTRYYVSWRSKILLVATEQIRLATPEENSAALIAKDATLTAHDLRAEGNTGYRDATFKQDYWKHIGNNWVRHHIIPRKTLFVPTQEEGGPDLEQLQETAVTAVSFTDGTVKEYRTN